jgi:fatty-acyl-CoA synthase
MAFAALRFALARLGAVLVPINFMLGPDEVAYILRHAGAPVGVAPDMIELGRDGAARDTQVVDCSWLPGEDTPGGGLEAGGDAPPGRACAASPRC